MGSLERTVVWNHGDVECVKYFVGQLKGLSDKTSITLERTALVTDPDKVALRNCSAKYLCWLI